jgi:hypothetical protein
MTAGVTLVASQPPIRNAAGSTVDGVWMPLADSGYGNPMSYHLDSDDFMPYRSTDYTATTTGTGAAIVGIAGDGGLITMSAGTTASVVSLQRPFADYTINTQPKKVFFEARFRLNQLTAISSVIIGLIQTTATPATVTDGVYLSMTGAGVWTINSMIGSVLTSVTIPTAAWTFAANANIDVGFYITRLGDVLAFLDTQLIGYIPQSQIGDVANGPLNAGAVARIIGPTLTTANLNPTIAINTSGTSTTVMTLDLFQAQKER